ncbi:uncharacterized protein LOC128377453 [Scomber japonicus]|uniref:uncharacterized protein LOC128377453 n=1 Tax=Scomber japonicus TaxID=13676 RepID=UPI00230531F0|nr:uncharacterized protein LOC128377453 [Scomber japonicus]
MAEVGSCKQLADHRGAGLQEEDAAVPAYCREGLRIGGTEFCFEERRAQKYFQQKQQKMDERMKQMQEVEQQLLQELEEKTRLLEQRRSQQTRGSAPQPRDSGRPPAPPTAASFQIFDESQSQPTAAAAARPSGKSGEDEVFLQPDETGPSIQCHRPGDVVPSARAQMEPRPSHRKELSPIQEASSLGAMPAGNCSPLEEEHPPTPAGGAVDPCDPDIRRRLLDLCDVTSCPDLHSEPRPLPTVEEHSCLQLGVLSIISKGLISYNSSI